MAEIIKALILALSKFQFKRKKTGGTYEALQFAVPVQHKTRKGKVIIKMDVGPFLKMTEREIDALLIKHEIDSKAAKIHGANRILRSRAAGSGMVDDVISMLHTRKIAIPDASTPEKLAQGYRALAGTILGFYRDKQRLGKKDWTIERCFSAVID